MFRWRAPLLGLLVAGVYLLHQDWWNWDKIEPLVLGFLPVGLGYHAAYSMVAALVMAALVKWAWPEELDRMEAAHRQLPESPPR